MYAVNVLADSINPKGERLTTLEATFPRFILAELNTHRMLSRNSASSRAIPTEKQIERVMNHPFIPEFNKRVTGMGYGEPLEPRDQRRTQWRWLEAREAAVAAAKTMLHVDKARANRLLEPFMWHTAIVSATDWDNFYALRCHPDAQPEFQTIAKMMQEAMWLSEPEPLEWGDWHLPLIDPVRDLNNPGMTGDDWQQKLAEASAGRCARVSYDKQHEDDALEASRDRWALLSGKGHWSPGEHPAQAVDCDGYIGNFKGWRPLRKFYDTEAVFSGS
jgi:thymidylate synthase ThyX